MIDQIAGWTLNILARQLVTQCEYNDRLADLAIFSLANDLNCIHSVL